MLDKIPFSDLLRLSDKTAIVTGGAMGIGRAIVFRLAEAGATVIIADKDAATAALTAREISDDGYKAISLPCDIRDEKQVKAMVESAAQKTRRIDILVNNAGIYPPVSLSQTTPADFDHVMAVNLRGALLCCREVAAYMIRQDRGGSIINIASMDALHPADINFAIYDASKAGMLALTRSLALELGKNGIKVNAIAPGGIVTEGAKKLVGELPGRDLKQMRKFISRAALGRMGRPDEIACVVLFLASEMSSYITGSVVLADGGFLVG
jgi:2-deoxy-D-gluconate 3-dehydrogenase